MSDVSFCQGRRLEYDPENNPLTSGTLVNLTLCSHSETCQHFHSVPENPDPYQRWIAPPEDMENCKFYQKKE